MAPPIASLTVATRKSQLALAQCRAWMREVEARWPGVALHELHVTTTGDRVQDRALNEIGGKGLFIKEIEEAILERRAQIAVHSLKDVPAELALGLCISCVPAREDARDVVVTRDGRPFSELSPGAKVGTSSLRRRVQLSMARPDLEFVPLRGNVDTRLKRVQEGVVDAVVLARAGLNRLGLGERASDVLPPELCLPAVGQGALAVEQRGDDDAVRELLAPLSDQETALAVAAERGVMLAVEGSCQIPVAAYAVHQGDRLLLEGFLAEIDGSRPRRARREVSWPADEASARALGQELGLELKQA